MDIQRLKKQNDINKKTRNMFIFFVFLYVFSFVIKFMVGIVGLFVKADLENLLYRLNQCIQNKGRRSSLRSSLSMSQFGKDHAGEALVNFEATIMFFILSIAILAFFVYLSIVLVIAFVVVHFENKLIPDIEEVIIKLEHNVNVSQEEYEKIAKDQKRVSYLSTIYASTFLAVTLPIGLYLLGRSFVLIGDVNKDDDENSSKIPIIGFMFLTVIILVPLTGLYSYIIDNNKNLM